MPIASELTITSSSALTLAQTIFGSGVTVTSATLTGTATQSGVYSGADATLGEIAPSDSGIILSTGTATDFTNSSGTTDTNTSTGISTDHATAGDADLDAISGQTTFDAVVLEADFTPVGDYITMQFTFSSEEYLEYVNGGVNDVFGVWVNGVYAPFTPAPNDLVSIDTINNVEASNLYLDNPDTADTYNTEMDGSTITLSIKAPVISGTNNTIKIALADGGDTSYDSNVLIAANSVQTYAIAFEDSVEMLPNTAINVDVLANDTDVTGTGLTITEINGNAVVAGQTVVLPSGQSVTLNADNTLTVESTGAISSEPFTYAVTDGAGNTDVGYVTINTVASPTLNYIVEGTGGDELIDASYTSDPQGDRIDNLDHSDASNSDSILAGDGSDTILSGLGDDTIYADAGISSNGSGNTVSINSTNYQDTTSGYKVTAQNVVFGTQTSASLANVADGGGWIGAGGTVSDTDSGVQQQTAYDLASGVSETLIFEFDQPTTSLSFTTYSLQTATFGEVGHYAIYNQGVLVYETDFTDTTGTGNTTINVSGHGEFDQIVFSSNIQTDLTDGSDYGISDLTFTLPATNDDSVDAGAGNDIVYAGIGNDSLDSGAGNDTIYGEEGNDTIYGGTGTNELSGGAGNDVFVLDGSNDTLYGGDGWDVIDQRLNTETFNVGSFYSIEEIYASNVGDTWNWVSDPIVFHGGAGADTINSGSGVDAIEGGGGDDVFSLSDNFGNDTITGGELGETKGDTLDLSGITTGVTVDLSSANPETGSVSDGTSTASFTEIENITLSGGRDTVVLADGSGSDTVNAFDLTDSGDGTTNDQLDVSKLTDASGNPVNVADVTVTDTIGDGSGDAILTFPNGESITLVGVLSSQVSSFAQLEALGIPGVGPVDGTAGADSMGIGYTDAQSDQIDGADGLNDTIYGYGGNDSIVSGAGDDLVDGGAGNDDIWTTAGTDTLLGGAGFDSFILTDGTWDGDTFVGGGSESSYTTDFISASWFASETTTNLNVTYTGDDDGTITDGTSSATFTDIQGFSGGAGDDYIDASASTQYVELYDGSGGAGSTQYGDDTLIGGSAADFLGTYKGNDSIFGGDGNDTIRDTGFFADSSETTFDSDTLDGGAGDDWIRSTGGYATVLGGAGNDTIEADGSWVDLGGPVIIGDVSVDGGSGNDSITAGAGLDTVYGGTGDDFIAGQMNDDSLYGGTGDDFIDAGADADRIILEDDFGNDTIIGGETTSWTSTSGDNDTLDMSAVTTDTTVDLTSNDPEAGSVSNGTGTASFSEIENIILGGGRDTIVLADGSGADTVQAFDLTDSGDGTTNDQLDVSGLTDASGNPVNVADVTVTDTNGDGSGDAILTFPNGESITLVGVLSSQVDSFAELEAMGIPAVGPVDGTAGNDNMPIGYTDAQGDIIDGADGLNDTIYGYAGNDTIAGGAGDDLIDGGAGNDRITDGLGNDTIFGGDGYDRATLTSGGGDDIITDVEGVYLQGDIGNDTVAMTQNLGAADPGQGAVGIDENWNLTFSDGQNATSSDGTYNLTLQNIYEFDAYGAINVLDASNSGQEIQYNTWSGDHTVTGSDYDDVMFYYSGGGTAYFDGGLGDDSLEGDTGADTLLGGAGNDEIVGDAGPNSIGSGDYIDLGAGNDAVWAGAGNDTILGGTGADDIDAGYDADLILLEDNFGNDTIWGGETFNTGTDNDTLDLSAVTTDTTVDLTSVDSEAGTVSDGTSTATFGGIENIVLGGGRDTVVLADGSGADTVQAFDLTDSGDGTTNDQLDVSGLTSDGGTTPVTTDDVVVTDTNGDGTGDAILTFPGGESITLVGVLASQVDSAAELVAIGIPSNGAVNGTTGDDAMPVGYIDSEGDIIDGADGYNDTIYGYGGNDTIDAGGGSDTIYGGDGNDSISGDSASGNTPSFVSVGNGGSAVGTTGTDYFLWQAETASNSTIWFDDQTGGDRTGDGEPDYVLVNTTNDTNTLAVRGFDYGTDKIILQEPYASIVQTPVFHGGDEWSYTATVTYSNGNTQQFNIEMNGTGPITADQIFTSELPWTAGDDLIDAGAGDDVVLGAEGNDTVYGQGGNDTIDGGAGNDLIDAGAGLDIISTSAGTDVVTGGDDQDVIQVSNIADLNGDTLAGGEGGTDGDTLSFSASITDDINLTFTGAEAGTISSGTNTASFLEMEGFNTSSGNDTIDASVSNANLVIQTNLGDDSVIGGSGSESIYLGGGNDTVLAGAGTDLVNAGAGDDSIVGGTGGDTLDGGSGDDTFVLSDNFGSDVITGGELGESNGDTLDLGAVTTDTTVDLTANDPEAGTVTSGADVATFSEIENIVLGAGRDTIVLADGSGSDTVNAFDLTDSGDGTTNDQLDVSGLTDAGGYPVNVADVIVTDTVGDGSGDAILTFPNGESITLVGVLSSQVSSYAQLEALGIPAFGPVDGTAGNDSMGIGYTDAQGDIIDGIDGLNDTIYGYAGNDTIRAGAGNDTVEGGTGGDFLYGDAGDDLVDGGIGDDYLFSDGGGSDTLLGGEGSDRLYTERFGPVDGNTTIVGGETGTDNDFLYTTAQSDGSGVNLVFSGDEAGNITFANDGGTATFSEIEGFFGTLGDDTIDATNDSTGIYVWGNGGTDSIVGGSGNDTLQSASGNDTILSGTGDDSINAGDGADSIEGGAGDDFIDASFGNDIIDGGIGADSILGGVGDDTIQVFDGFGNDTIDGHFQSNPTGDVLDLSGVTTDLSIDLTSTDAEDGSFTDGTSTATFIEIENIVLGGGRDTIVLADGSGADTVQAFDLTDSGDGTTNDQLDVSALTSDGGTTPVTTNDVIVTDTNGDGTGDAILTFPGGESITLVGVLASQVDDPAELVAIGIPVGPDFIVEGTAGADTIDEFYLGDPEGDMVDANDALDGSNDDSILGFGGADLINAGLGNDIVDGGTESDTIYGGMGNDTLLGGDGSDSLYGNEGNDSIVGGLGDDTVEAGTGDDVIIGGAGNDSINGDFGNDSIVGGDGNDWLRGSFGNDTIIGGTGNDTVWGGFGDDSLVIDANFGNYDIQGEEEQEVLGDTMDVSAVTNDLTWDLSNANPEAGTFTDGTNTASYVDVENIILGSGTDTLVLTTFGGSDRVIGFEAPTDTGGGTYSGNDQLDVSGLLDFDSNPTHTGNVTVSDTVGDGSGDAVLTFPNGETLTLVGVLASEVSSPVQLIAMGIPEGPDGFVDGTAGDDTIDVNYTGDPNFDRIDNADGIAPAGPEDDYVRAGAGNDLVQSNAGNDYIELGDGADTGEGGVGADTIDGGAGADSLVGGFGNDSLIGGSGNDTLNGQLGDDVMEGGDGSDTFALEDDFGNDTIIGGEVDDAAGDTLDMSGVGGGLTYDLTGADPEAGTVTNGTSTLTFSEIENIGLSSGIDTLTLSNTSGDDTVTGFTAPVPVGDGSFIGYDQLDVSTLTDANGAIVNTGDVTITDTNGDGTGDTILTFPSGTSITLAGVPTSAFPTPEALFAIGIPLADYIVEGTAGGDLINSAYLGDPEGDLVDANDAENGSDDDSIEAGAGNDTIFAGDGNDTIIGDAGDDLINGMAGNDLVIGGLGNDSIATGDGSDSVIAGDGNDSINGGAGNDTIEGGAGNDLMSGAAGDDSMIGGDGADTFLTFNGFGNDTVIGSEGGVDDDTLSLAGVSAEGVSITFDGDESGLVTGDTSGNTVTFAGIENIVATDNADTINATSDALGANIDAGVGDDLITGGLGNDTLLGGAGNDTISGGISADSIDAGAGNDTINVAQGDTVVGGDGDDFFNLVDLGETDTGTITIIGGEGNETGGDTLALNGLQDMSTLVITDPDDVNGGLSGSVSLLDGTVVNFSNIENIICFTEGTGIATPYGKRRIEDLRVGDEVITQDNGIQRIEWVGKSTVKGHDKFAPVRFSQSVFPGAEADLMVSPQHRMLFKGYQAELLFGQNEVLVPAIHLVNGLDVCRMPSNDVTYIHIMFSQHEIVFADGIASESFHPGAVGVDALAPQARNELFDLFPELRSNLSTFGPQARMVLKSREARMLDFARPALGA